MFLKPDNTLQVNLFANMGGLMQFPVTFISNVGVENAQIKLTHPKFIASGMPIPDAVSVVIAGKINKILDVNEQLKEDFDIQVKYLEILPNDKIVIKANANVNKLDFGKKKKPDLTHAY